MLVCEPPQEGFGAGSPQLGGCKAERLFGVCVLASCKGTAVLQPGMVLACVCRESWGQRLLTSLDLALPLGNYVFNSRSMKTRWLEREQREVVCPDGGGPRGRAASGSGYPVLLAPLAHDGAVPAVQGRSDNHACRAGSRHSELLPRCLTWPDPVERPSGGHSSINRSLLMGLQSHGLHPAWDHSPAAPLAALM